MTEIQIPYIGDHSLRGRRDLLFRLQNGTRFRAFAEAIGTGVQLLEQITFDLIVSSGFTLATGVYLDEWGELVGEQRLGLDDADYRRFILARILANLSEGTTDELIVPFQIITGAEFVRFFDHFPAGFRLTAFRTDPLTDQLRNRIRQFMLDIKPGGVAMELTEAITPNMFLFSSGSNGFGSTFSRVI